MAQVTGVLLAAAVTLLMASPASADDNTGREPGLVGLWMLRHLADPPLLTATPAASLSKYPMAASLRARVSADHDVDWPMCD